MKMNVTRASDLDACIFTINVPAKHELRGAKDGSVVLLWVNPHKRKKVIWPWAFRVTRKGRTWATKTWLSILDAPDIGSPIEIEVYKAELLE